MIRLSRLADYAVILMAEFARRDEVFFSAQTLSNATKLPPATVSKLLKKLLKSQLLNSTKGIKGGYRLSRSAYKITIAEIIAAVDGPIGMTMCSIVEGECALEQLCTVRLGLKRINDIIHHELAKVTLAEIAHPYFTSEGVIVNVTPKEQV